MKEKEGEHENDKPGDWLALSQRGRQQKASMGDSSVK